MTTSTDAIITRAASGFPITDEQALALSECGDLDVLAAAARARGDLA